MDFSLISNFEAWDALAGEWNALLDQSAIHVPFLRHEYLTAWWQTLGGGEWQQGDLAVIVARRDGLLVGAAPLFAAPNRQGDPALLFIGSIEVSDYLDVLVAPTDLPVFIDGLMDFAATLPGWIALDLYNLLDSSPTLAELERAAQRKGWTYTLEQLQHSPYIPLPGDWEAYLNTLDKKQRHEVRRKMRRAEEAVVPARWYIVEDPATLGDEVEAFMALMAQDPEKSAFLTGPMRDHMRKVTLCAFDTGCLQLAFLMVGDEKAAGYLSFNYLDRLWVYNSGLDRRFMEYSPGWVLLGYLLQWANEHGIREFDFMRGDEDYKYRFGGQDRFVMRALIKRA